MKKEEMHLAKMWALFILLEEKYMKEARKCVNLQERAQAALAHGRLTFSSKVHYMHIL